MNNIQVIFNRIQNIDSFNYDSIEYIITQKLEKACDNYNLFEVSNALKKLSKFHENSRNARAEKSFLSNEKEISKPKNKEIIKDKEENKLQFRTPKWLYSKVFNGPRKETKPKKYQILN